ncbi:hypothetical protein GCM10027429_26040 [Marivirga atlantica]|jgi:hypothetical protein|uniref:Uncharacterized protein n=1 Tax=Marivirga atlantica TaxID=1548457 RepID=A0A937DKM7_9BACT|nr:hypothetical protein [Marivirga atlantica]MBL0766204.1 hypothetical protein [Marivirga atlantica]
MATVTIYVSKQADGKGLHFSDSEGHSGDNTISTKVKPGDTVIWKIAPNGGIDSITSITEKSMTENKNLFSSLPAPENPKDPKSDWSGVISETATGKEVYTVGYTIGNETYLHDPESNDPEPEPNDPDLEVDPDGN